MKERIIITTGTEEITIVLADFEVETPQEVESLAGDNVMWTDAQNLEVTYRSN